MENPLPTDYTEVDTTDQPLVEISVTTESPILVDPMTGEQVEIKSEVCEGHNEELFVETIDGAICLTDDEKKNIKVVPLKKQRRMRKVVPKKVSIKKALTSEISTNLDASYEAQCVAGEVKVLKATCLKQLTKIKTLNQKIRRSNQHNEKLKETIKELKTQNEVLTKNLENYTTLPNISALSNDLMKRQLAVKEGRELERVYPQEVRDFAINLNSFSPLAYRYVRESFNKVLPHKKTLIKWLRVPDCKMETLDTLPPSSQPPPPPHQLLAHTTTEVSEEMLIEISAQLEEPNADLFNYVEQYFPASGQPIPNQVKVVLTENGFNHLVSLMAVKDHEIEAMIEKNPDLPDGHMVYLRRLPQLLQEMSQKMAEPNVAPTPVPVHLSVAKKPAPKSNASFQVDRSSIVLKNLVCDWLNKNTESEKPYEKSHIQVTVDSSAMPFTGTIRCVICSQDINVNMQKYKKSETYIRWVIANFIKHFKKFHITKSTEIFLEPITNERGEIIAATAITPVKEPKRRTKPIKIQPKPPDATTTGQKRSNKRIKVEAQPVLVVDNLEKTEDMVEIEYMDGISVANIFGSMFYTND